MLHVLWKSHRSLLCGAPRKQILLVLLFGSTCPLLFLRPCIDGKSYTIFHHNLEQDIVFSRKRRKFHLTPQIVQSTLLGCPSDLIALKFFLWCSEQHNCFHDPQSFNCMIDVVSRLTLQYKTVKGIIGELESTGSAINAKTFLVLLRIYWCGGIHGNVFDTVEEMEKFGFTPNTFARNVVLDVLFKIGQPNAAIKVMRETTNPNFLTFNIGLGHFCKMKDIQNVKDVTRKLLKEGYHLNPEMFEVILNCFCKMGRVAEAYQVLGLMIASGASVSVNTWSKLIDCCFQSHQPSRAADVLRKMSGSGFSPNVVTYTILIKGFMECQMVDRALSILSGMETNGHGLDLVLCNVLIDCLSKIGRYDDALDVLVYLLERNLVPDSYTFSSLVSSICLSKRYSILPKIFGGFSAEADLILLNSLLNYFSKAGYPCHALQLYDYILDQGFMPDKYSFAGLLTGLCRAGKVDLAVSVYRGLIMTGASVDAHIHTIMIDELLKANEHNRAIGLFKRAIVEKYPLDIVCYTVAICGLLKGGRIGEASTMYRKMKGAGMFPNARMYNAVISAFCRIRDVTMVKMLMREAKEAGIELKHETLIRVVKLLLKSESYGSVIELMGIHGSNLQVQLDENLLSDSCGSKNLHDVVASAV